MSFAYRFCRIALALVLFACSSAGFALTYFQGTLTLGETGLVSKTFRIPAATLVAIEAVSLDARPTLRVQMPDGVFLEAAATGRQSSLVFFAPREGEYLFRVLDREAPATAEITVRIQTPPAISQLPVGAAAYGDIRSTDFLSYENGRADLYRFVVPRSGKLLLLVESEAFDPTLTVYLPDGSFLQNDDIIGTDAGLYIAAAPGSTLYALVQPFSAQSLGRYSISALPQETIDIAVDSKTTGTLLPSGLLQNEYRFTAPTLGHYLVQVHGKDLYPTLEFKFSESSSRISSDGAAPLQQRLHLVAGQELILNINGGGSGKEFELSISKLAAPTPLQLGQPLSGQELLAGGPRDYSYTNATEQLQSLRIDMRSNDFDTLLSVLLPSGRTFTIDDSPTREEAFRSYITIPLEPGASILISAGSYNDTGSGSFSLLVETPNLPGEILEPGSEIALGGSYVGLLVGEEQIFNLNLTAGDSVHIGLFSDDFDAYLSVWGPSGEYWYDDDGHGGTNAFLAINAPASGEYEVYVKGYSEEAAGLFDLSITNAQGVGTVLEFPGTLDGLYEEIQFNAQAGDLLIIEASSTDFDTLISLYSPSGFYITENDDYGESSNSRIVARIIEGGRQTLELSAYGGSGEEGGDFLVRIQRQ